MPAVAIDDGSVSCLKNSHCNTKFARFVDSKGQAYQYFHMDSCIDASHVEKGQEIAIVGAHDNDNCSSGDHIHFSKLGVDENPVLFPPGNCYTQFAKDSNCCYGLNIFIAGQGGGPQTCYRITRAHKPKPRCKDKTSGKFMDYPADDPRCNQ
jgi:hypothetical protein